VQQSVEGDADMPCNICFDTYPPGEMRSAECGHAYCNDCWQGYLSSAIADGPSCLRLRCPMPDCGVLVRDPSGRIISPSNPSGIHTFGGSNGGEALTLTPHGGGRCRAN
jgi:ariadne-1